MCKCMRGARVASSCPVGRWSLVRRETAESSHVCRETGFGDVSPFANSVQPDFCSWQLWGFKISPCETTSFSSTTVSTCPTIPMCGVDFPGLLCRISREASIVGIVRGLLGRGPLCLRHSIPRTDDSQAASEMAGRSRSSASKLLVSISRQEAIGGIVRAASLSGSTRGRLRCPCS